MAIANKKFMSCAVSSTDFCINPKLWRCFGVMDKLTASPIASWKPETEKYIYHSSNVQSYYSAITSCITLNYFFYVNMFCTRGQSKIVSLGNNVKPCYVLCYFFYDRKNKFFVLSTKQ